MKKSLHSAKAILLHPDKRAQLSFTSLFIVLLVSYLINTPSLSFFIIGGIFGATLNYFQFGFRTCSQQLLTQSKTLGIRAVLIMLAVCSLFFFPLLSLGHFGNQTLVGFVQPLSLSVVAGAFMFGIGMQLANGCTSGTLNKLGQLQPLSLTSFIFLLVGGSIAAYHADFWDTVPALPPYSILEHFGLAQGLMVQFGILAIFYGHVLRKEKRHFGSVSPLFPTKIWQITQWHPWLKASLFLALMNVVLLLLSGRPWSIANIFPIWGIKISDLLHLPLDWSFWSYGMTHFVRIESSVLQDTVSLTTLGLVSGALLVTLLRGKSGEAISERTHFREHLYAIIGGTIMGYGAVIAFGCNIGAFFSGISSGSLHGWLWAISALGGNALGIYLKKRLP